MLHRFRANLRERHVHKLALATLEETKRLYQSGEFEWIAGDELQAYREYEDGFSERLSVNNPRGWATDEYIDSSHIVDENHRVDGFGEFTLCEHKIDNPDDAVSNLDKATYGCALGGLSKAAWLVTGKPKPGEDAWLDKLDAEVEAQFMLAYSIRREASRTPEAVTVPVDHVLGTITGRNDGTNRDTILADIERALGR